MAGLDGEAYRRAEELLERMRVVVPTHVYEGWGPWRPEFGGCDLICANRDGSHLVWVAYHRYTRTFSVECALSREEGYRSIYNWYAFTLPHVCTVVVCLLEGMDPLVFMWEKLNRQAV